MAPWPAPSIRAWTRAEADLDALHEAGIDMKDVSHRLEEEGVASFSKSLTNCCRRWRTKPTSTRRTRRGDHDRVFCERSGEKASTRSGVSSRRIGRVRCVGRPHAPQAVTGTGAAVAPPRGFCHYRRGPHRDVGRRLPPAHGRGRPRRRPRGGPRSLRTAPTYPGSTRIPTPLPPCKQAEGDRRDAGHGATWIPSPTWPPFPMFSPRWPWGAGQGRPE